MDFNFIKIGKKESSALEIIKIFLLVQVVVGHALALSFPQIGDLSNNIIVALFKSLFSFGREAAYLFVFLSGFFTSKVFLQETDDFNLYKKIKTHVIRIYPIYLSALLFTILLDYIGYDWFNYSVYVDNVFNCDTTKQYTFYNFFINLFSLQPVLGATFGSNTPLWTLGYLVQFYVLGVLLKKVAIIGAFNYHYLIFGTIFLIAFWNLEFALLFFVWYSGVLLKDFQFVLSRYFRLISILFCLCLLIVIQRFSPMLLSMLLTPLTGFFILMLVKIIPHKVIGVNLLDFPRLPDISYSLYAVYMPLLFIIYGFFNDLLDMNSFLWQFCYVLFSFFTCLICAYVVLKINTPSVKIFK